MNAETLISRCHDLGVTLSPLPSGMLRVQCNVEISDMLRSALKDNKPEVLAILEAMEWLKPRLAEPKRIADLISEWCGGKLVLDRDQTVRWEGGRDGLNGRDIDALLAARWQLKLYPFTGDDGLSWWRLPEEPQEWEQ